MAKLEKYFIFYKVKIHIRNIQGYKKTCLFILFSPFFPKLNPDMLIFGRISVLYLQFEES